MQWVVVVVVASLGLAGLAGAVQKGSWLSAVVTVMFVGPLVCFALSLTERDKQPTGSFRLVSPGRSGPILHRSTTGCMSRDCDPHAG